MVFRSTLLVLFTSFSLTTTSTILTNSEYFISEKDKILLNDIKEDMRNNSDHIRDEQKYHYQNQVYDSKQEIVDELLTVNPIVATKTVSNPNKIIANYETELLNEHQIYDLNLDNTQKVYKDATGRVVLPSCSSLNSQRGCVISNKSPLDRAVDSYINPGLTKTMYTYDQTDNATWYSTLTDAKLGYQNQAYTVHDSLFYDVNGVYYNAFNSDDMEKMKKTEMIPAYRYIGSNQPNDLQAFSAPVDHFKNDYLEQLKTFLSSDQNFNLIDDVFHIDDGTYVLKFIINNTNTLSINVTGTLAQYIDIVNDGKSKIIKLNAFAKNLGLTPEAIRDGFNNSKNSWVEDEHFRHVDKTYSLNLSTFQGNLNLQFTLVAEEDDLGSSLINDFSLGAVAVNTVEPNDINVQITKEGSSIVYNRNTYVNAFRKILNFLTAEPSSSTYIINQSDLSIINQYGNKPSSLKSLKEKIIDVYLNEAYDNFINNKSVNITVDSDFIIPDYVYGGRNNTDYSLVETQAQFLTNLNNKLQNRKIEDLTEIAQDFSLIGSFKTTYANWTNNFFDLASTSDAPLFKLRHLYYVDGVKNRDDSIVSFSATAPNISSAQLVQPTYQGAADQMMNFDHSYYQTKYNIYDLNGTLVESDQDLQKAYAKLRSDLAVDYKLIPEAELVNYADQDVLWTDLISDGEYIVYYFTDSTNKKFYFKSYEQALDNYVNTMIDANQIMIETLQVKDYVIKINGVVTHFQWSNEVELEQKAEEILSLL